MNKHICPICKKKFDARKDQVFCSRSCAAKHSNPLRDLIPWNKGLKGIAANRKRNGENKTCKHCGVSFYVSQGRAAAAEYCSMTCYHADRWGHTGTCQNCGKTADTKFCTPKCQKEFWDKNGYTLQKKRRIWERKLAIITELGSKCARCGNADLRVLDLHHIDPSKKVIPKKRQYTWLRRLADWEKNRGNLELICANCHRIHTWEQLGFQKVNGKDIWA